MLEKRIEFNILSSISTGRTISDKGQCALIHIVAASCVMALFCAFCSLDWNLCLILYW